MGVAGEVQNRDLVMSRMVELSATGATVPAYFSTPVNKSNGTPLGILIAHEGLGLIPHMRDVADRLANLGYWVIVPDLFARSGSPDINNLAEVIRLSGALPDAQVVGDLDAAAHYLRKTAGAEIRLAVLGFCAGGRQAILYACQHQVACAISCYGGFLDRASDDAVTSPERPQPPLEMLSRLSGPLFAAYGEEDINPSPADGDKLHQSLARQNKSGTVKIYPNAGHAFFNDTRPRYRPDAAHAMWGDLVAFLKTHLGAPTIF